MTTMYRRLTSALAMLGLLFSSTSQAEPLYWSAVKGQKQLLLLGSVHMGEADMYPLPQPVEQFFARSDALILETLLDQATPSLAQPEKQESAAEALSVQQQEKLTAISRELHIPDQALLHLPAWQAAVSLQLAYLTSLGYQQQYGVDNYLLQQARMQKMQVKQLETPDYQLSLFTSNPIVGRQLLEDAVDNWEQNKQQGLCLLDNWRAGDSQSLLAMATESELSGELAEQFIYRRNQAWADKLDSTEFLPRKGRYLIVVGALHLVGERSLTELLAERGFRVTRLSKPEPSLCLR